MEIPSSPTPDMAQFALYQKKLTLENKIKGGVNWFFWIAGLSLVNSIFFLFGFSLTFVVGLGITQIVDGFMASVATDIGEGGIIARLIGFGINIFIAGVFLVFGVLGRKRFRWAIILGMVFYAIDTVLMLLFKDFFGAAFHAWAMFSIWNGLKSIKELKLLEESGDIFAIESISQQFTPLQQPAVTPKQTRTRLILVGAICLVVLACVVFSILQS